MWAQVHDLAGLYAEGKLALELEGLPAGEIPVRAIRALDDLLFVVAIDPRTIHPQDIPGKNHP